MLVQQVVSKLVLFSGCKLGSSPYHKLCGSWLLDLAYKFKRICRGWRVYTKGLSWSDEIKVF